ncbi:acyltransferase [Actinorhabdospora filicis]|uniref:Acyltransferase n=1 Tax=Actinorhabdospora filicis TaxID=1785913 RepID=A0A9W6SU00_9ACTN|nr:acyltransferase [Actinorhabdospora filicis]
MRWFAALLIFLYHFSYEDKSYGTAGEVQWLKHTFFGGPTAVSFFFVLSGFVLAWTLRADDTKVGFWRRRFARIYPSHLVMFLVALVALPWLAQHFSWRAALANVTLTQAWVPGDDRIWFGFNGVSWSLSCEFFFYAMFPFLARWLRGLSVRGWYVVGGLSCLFVVVLPFTVEVFRSVLGWTPLFVTYLLPPLRLPDFLAGICLAFIVKAGKWRGPGVVISLGLCAAALFWGVHQVPDEFHRAAVTVIPFSLLIAAAASADLRGAPSVFRNKRIVYLGEISFCFYLVHELVIYLANHVMGSRDIATVPNLIAVFCIALVGAVLLHEFVEKPGVKLLSGSRKKTRPRVTRIDPAPAADFEERANGAEPETRRHGPVSRTRLA